MLRMKPEQLLESMETTNWKGILNTATFLIDRWHIVLCNYQAFCAPGTVKILFYAVEMWLTLGNFVQVLACTVLTAVIMFEDGSSGFVGQNIIHGSARIVCFVTAFFRFENDFPCRNFGIIDKLVFGIQRCGVLPLKEKM